MTRNWKEQCRYKEEKEDHQESSSRYNTRPARPNEGKKVEERDNQLNKTCKGVETERIQSLEKKSQSGQKERKKETRAYQGFVTS